MDFSEEISPDTHLFKALMHYRQLVLLDVKTYQKLLIACFNEFKIVTVEDIVSFFSLYKQLEFGYMYYQINNNIIQFVCYDSLNTVNDYFPVPDVLHLVEDKYGNLKSFESIRSFIQSLYIYQTIKKQKDLKNVSDPKGFEEKLVDSIKELHGKETLIVTGCLVLISQKQANKLIIEINNDIFYDLAKSILNAEYLFIDKYSWVLRESVVSLLRAGMKVIGNEDSRDIYPYTVRSFVKLAWYTEEICKHISRSLKDPATHLVSANTDRDARFDVLPQPDRFIGKGNTLRYELLLESILDMTLIDHCYQTTGPNLEKLFLLLEREKIFDDISPSNKDINSDKKFTPIRIIARRKAATLLMQMLKQDRKNKSDYNLKYYFNINSDTLWDAYVEDIQRECIPTEVIKANPWLAMKDSHKNRILPVGEVLKSTGGIYSAI